MPLFSRRSATPTDVPPLPYDPRSPEGLAARWVQWVASIGPVKNPLVDDTGEYAAVHQPEDVWFLAGSSGKRMVRQCFVPLGRELFLPAFNMWEVTATGPAPVVEDAWGSVTVDGAEVPCTEIATQEPFVVSGARLNGVTNSKTAMPMVVWGLWARIAPLAPGAHEVHARGGDGHGFEVDVTYRLGVGGIDPAYRSS
jgi:hypothetical protein